MTPKSPASSSRTPAHNGNPVIPPINGYGSIRGTNSRTNLPTYASHISVTSVSSHSSDADERNPLLPGSVAPHRDGLIGGVSRDLIPFSGIAAEVASWFRGKPKRRAQSIDPDAEAGIAQAEADLLGGVSERHYWTHAKHRPTIAGGGQNVPLQVVRSLTCYLSVCEERGCVPGASFKPLFVPLLISFFIGTTLGNMLGCLAAFEDSLSSAHRIQPFQYDLTNIRLLRRHGENPNHAVTIVRVPWSP